MNRPTNASEYITSLVEVNYLSDTVAYIKKYGQQGSRLQVISHTLQSNLFEVQLPLFKDRTGYHLLNKRVIQYMSNCPNITVEMLDRQTYLWQTNYLHNIVIAAFVYGSLIHTD